MTASRKALASQSDVVEAFGGHRQFAARFGLSRTAPYNYVSGTPWPISLHCRVIAECAEAGIELSPDLLHRIPPKTLMGIARYIMRWNKQ
jgi:hypothetical protein